MLLGKHDNQQREVRFSSQQRRETHVSKPKWESRVYSTECELRVSEPCLTKTCKVNIRSPTAKIRRDMKSPRPQRLEAGLFDPPLTDLRDYLIKKKSFHQITP